MAEQKPDPLPSRSFTRRLCIALLSFWHGALALALYARPDDVATLASLTMQLDAAVLAIYAGRRTIENTWGPK